MDRDSWEKDQETVRKERRAHRAERATLTPIALAEPPMQRMTKSGDWNFFLKILQNRLELAQSNLLEVEVADRGNTDFDAAKMSALKSSRREWAQRIATLEEVMAIPGEILGDAQRAKQILEEESRGKET